MADHPILFSGPMVRAILEGRKTQTRRVLKPIEDHPSGYVMWPIYGFARDAVLRRCGESQNPDRAAPYTVGDRLWVREAWKPHSTFDHLPPREMPPSNIFYLADPGYSPSGSRGRPGIHMPRWASRITLRVTGVKVERLQDISESDAIAEGVQRLDPTPKDEAWNVRWCEENGYPIEPLQPVWIAPRTRQGWGMTAEQRNKPQWGPTPQFAFRCLWESINGHGSWQANPWVAAYSFEPILQNIDKIEARP